MEMKKQGFQVRGMTCSACSSHVEKSVGKLAGIKKVSVNLLTNSMQVEYEEEICSPELIVAAVEKAGYGASTAGKPTGSSEENRAQNREANQQREELKGKKENLEMKTRLIVSLVFMILLMAVSMNHMFFMWLGLPVPDFLHHLFYGNENALTFAFTQFLLTLPIIYVNRKYYKTGLKTLLHGSPNMDSLIAIGSGAALLYGVFAIYRIGYGLGHGDEALVAQYAADLYFESAGMILALITVGKYLETRSKGKTSEAITKLMDLSPKTAILLSEKGEEKEIPTENLQKGDLFLVKPGSSIPVDGIVVEGTSSIDEAAITGESIPVEKQPGDTVVSAGINKAGRLICKAVKVGEDTTLAQIIRLVEEASSSKAPIARLADKIAGIFVPVVIGIAALTLAVWLLAGGSFEQAMSCAIAVLVISCPCALGLATPVAIMVGTGVGAKNGILIKSGDALQSAREINTVVLDKTGTITEGKPKVTDILVYRSGLTKQQAILLAAAIEKPSEHPLAEAVVEKAREYGGEIQDAEEFQAVFGKGVKGKIKSGWGENSSLSELFLAGNRSFLKENNVILTYEQNKTMEKLAEEGKTPLLFAGGNELFAIIAVADTVKETSIQAIEQFRQMKIDVVMLTGDNKRTAEAVQKKLKINQVIAEVLPADKEKEIRKLQQEGRKVAMIGDGINDAPALAAADVGIAIGAGTDVAIDSADIILMKSRLTDAITAISLSKAVIRNIKENLFWAFFYNSIGIPLAAGLLYPAFGLKLSPMFGAAAMSLSSLFVVGNALRLKNFKPVKINRDEREETKKKQDEQQNRRQNRQEENKEKEGTGMEQKHFQTAEEGRSITMEKIMIIEGMSCSHCTGRVQKALEELDGVESAVLSLEEKKAVVTLGKEISDSLLQQTVTDAGYEVVEIK